ncbi:MAG: hypothetical protein HYW49_00775 [Deltaproteobacteria bacterium]|nr:hypothetical protein [Deltaproteobacteria bacterium]
MRDPIFESIIPNYRKNVLEIVLVESRKKRKYFLPFSVFDGPKISSKNRFRSIRIDSELNRQAAEFVLDDGSKGDFHVDYVLYHCDPSYDWSPVNQLKKVLKGELEASRLSIRVIADALKTSPSQVMRLLQQNKASKQLTQLFQIAGLAGYTVEFKLKKRKAA